MIAYCQRGCGEKGLFPTASCLLHTELVEVCLLPIMQHFKKTIVK